MGKVEYKWVPIYYCEDDGRRYEQGRWPECLDVSWKALGNFPGMEERNFLIGKPHVSMVFCACGRHIYILRVDLEECRKAGIDENLGIFHELAVYKRLRKIREEKRCVAISELLEEIQIRGR
jgi:hypothetical protein